MARWYQNAVINGEVMPAQRRGDTSQRRWAELLEPLVPTEGKGRRFLELGCNAGFYLRKASELGYTTLGIEKESAYLEHAKYWETQEPRGVRVEFGDITEYEIPASFLVLLANVHYWLTPDQVNKVVEQLKERALYVIVVSRHKPDPRHLSDCTETTLDQIFDGWEHIKSCSTEKHFSVLYRNPNLVEYDTINLYNIQPFNNSKRFLSSFTEYIDLVLSRKRFRLDKTPYWEYAKWRGWKDKEKNLRRLRKMILLAERDGISTPIDIKPNGLLIDGNHRLIIAKHLGFERMICKQSYT